MSFEQEMALLQKMIENEMLVIDNIGIAAIPSKEGRPGHVLVLLRQDSGKEFVVPINSELALKIGEQLMRAADAIDKNLVYAPKNNTEGGGIR
ncbi:hypothetical protein ACB478_000658 [Klebsiella quasipneumoniae]|uniref:hypothetical protein n=1 Tax=Klebsiella variicola TaxID=244366 RepID=UPI00218101AB|nr:hypothetical protein [Klebsiella variicola]GKL54970.1 hypothetical protein NUKP61_25220 [Klebsiella variicola]HCI8762172.1 hypothetical protein [Klebsiella variicola]